MEQNGNKGTDKERIIKFALMIQQKLTSKGIETKIQSQNEGINDAAVILIIESWLKKVKENFQNNITGGMSLGKQPPKK